MSSGADPIVVVGAGPSGSVLALLLCRAGRKVVLLDRARFPRRKACGESLNPGAVGLLERLGLLPRVLALAPATIRGWGVQSRCGLRVRGGFPRCGSGGLGLPRETLDQALVDAAVEAGTDFREEHRVMDIGQEADGVTVTVQRRGGWSDALRTPLLVGADGLRSVVAARLDLVERPPRIRKASFTYRLSGPAKRTDRGLLLLERGLVLGLAPLSAKSDLWNATLVVDPARYGEQAARHPEGLLWEALERLDPELAGGLSVLGSPKASGAFDRPVPRAASGRVMLVGDASGYFDPLTGQGVFRALRSAWLGAGAVLEALPVGDRFRPHALASYSRALRREFDASRRFQRGVEAVLSRDLPARLALAALALAPGGLGPILRVTGDVGPVRGLLDPRAWLFPATPEHPSTTGYA